MDFLKIEYMVGSVYVVPFPLPWKLTVMNGRSLSIKYPGQNGVECIMQ